MKTKDIPDDLRREAIRSYFFLRDRFDRLIRLVNIPQRSAWHDPELVEILEGRLNLLVTQYDDLLVEFVAAKMEVATAIEKNLKLNLGKIKINRKYLK